MRVLWIAPVILIGLSACADDAALQQNGVIRHSADELIWAEGPDEREIAVLYGDPSGSGPFVIRVRFPPNHEIGRHWHPTTEFATILSGTVHFAFGEGAGREDASAFGPGSFFAVPAKVRIVGWTEDQDVLIQVHGEAPFEVNPVPESTGAIE